MPFEVFKFSEFLQRITSKLSKEAKIRYRNLVEVVDVFFGCLDFLVSVHPVIAPKSGFLVGFSHFLSSFLA